MKQQELTMYNSAARRRRGADSPRPVAAHAAVEPAPLANGRLAALLGIDCSAAVVDALRGALLDPVASLTANPGKRIRGQLLAMTYRLFHDDREVALTSAKQCRDCAEVVELIHAGSLVIDDIEDGSAMRRGRPAMHLQIGLPLALNAGNWLYFWPFELLKDSGLSAEQLLLAYERYNRTLLRAHFGQALDLGAKMAQLPRQSVAEICLANMTLKSGALMGFAALLGGMVARQSAAVVEVLDNFGVDLGVALQMYDDLGNVIGKCDPEKRYEDLILSRPSWVWACAANSVEGYEYEGFLKALGELPNAKPLECWIVSRDLIQTTRASARQHLNLAFDRLERRLCAAQVAWSTRVFNELRQLGEDIAVAYG